MISGLYYWASHWPDIISSKRISWAQFPACIVVLHDFSTSGWSQYFTLSFNFFSVKHLWQIRFSTVHPTPLGILISLVLNTQCSAIVCIWFLHHYLSEPNCSDYIIFCNALLHICKQNYTMEKNIESNLFRYDYKIDLLLASGCEYDLCITVIFDPYTGQVNKVNTHDYLLLCLWVQSRPVVTFWLW